MKIKGIITILFVLLALSANTTNSVLKDDNKPLNPLVLDTDSLLENFLSKDKISSLKDEILNNAKRIDSLSKALNNNTDIDSVETVLVKNDTVILPIPLIFKDSVIQFTLPEYVETIPHDTTLLLANPFFIDLVFKELPLKLNLKPTFDFAKMYFGKPKSMYANGYVKTINAKKSDEIIDELRQDARIVFNRTNTDLYSIRFDELPDPNGVKNHIISTSKLSNIKFVDDDKIGHSNNKLYVKDLKAGPWTRKASTLMQFSQNLVSDNWHQGGNSNMAVLGILTGQFNYDNKKNIQFENYAEWKMGFYYVNDTTALRAINTNNDIFKLNSKLGFKIDDNWFYTGTVDFSTNFLNNYKAVNSSVLKAGFLTPIRVNVGFGLDYKYKKIFSLVLSPLSYKYIYVNDTMRIDQKQFGVKKGENTLSEIGSALKAQLSYAPKREIQIDSKLSFYTNYKKMEIDWEIVGNFTINRFLSTRISINPRYDNTVIEAKGVKAKLQFKELLSFGFSYKFLN